MVVNDPPLVLTERLELRLPVADDFASTLAIVSDAETGRFLGPCSEAQHFLRFCRSAGSWLLYGYGMFVVRLRGSDEVIGNCGIFHSIRELGADFDDAPEAGWILRRDQAGKGLAHEAMAGVLAWFEREHGPRRVTCLIAPGNDPSIRLAAKLGFALMREAQLPDGEAVRLFERIPG